MKRIPVDLEYIFKASPAILYKFLTTPACLVRWFCDGVDINNDVYTFSWDGAEENAEVVDDIEEERLVSAGKVLLRLNTSSPKCSSPL